MEMVNLSSTLRNPDDFYPLVKLKLAMRKAEKQIPAEPHWAFCYSMLHKVSRSFALVIQQLDTDLRDAVIFVLFVFFFEFNLSYLSFFVVVDFLF